MNTKENEKSRFFAIFIIIGLLIAAMIISFIFVDEPTSGWLRHNSTKYNHNAIEKAFEQLGKVYPIVWLLLFWVWITGKHKTVLIGLLAMIITIPAVWSIKAAVQRPRPRDAMKAEAKIENRTESPQKWSFPSGDTASVFAVGTVLAISAQWPGIIGIAVCCCIVGVLRVWNSAHYPSDVFAGAALGIFCGWAAIRIRNKDPKIENILGGTEQTLSFAGIFLIPLFVGLFQGPNKLNILLTFYTPAAAVISLAGLRRRLQDRTEQINTAFIDQMRKQGNWFFKWRSFLPLLIAPLFIIKLRDFTYPWDNHLLDRLWGLFCLTISLLGLGIRIYTVGNVPKRTSGRTTSQLKAQELNTTGTYSIVRHPLYLGNFVIWVGIVLFARSISLAAFCLLAFVLYYERIIIAEEEFLSQKFGEVFTKWADKTPMIVPRFKLWCKPAQPFSWLAVINREYSGLLTITASFIAIEALGDRFYEGRWKLDWMWAVIFCISLLASAAIGALKKTGILRYPQSPCN
jgi:protein-S-isoprenylcysteine O-methyltransferase Ste14/membrane-associated phospholipid phosphatase